MQTFEDLVDRLDLQKFTDDPESELQARGLKVHKTLLEHMSQIKDLDGRQADECRRGEIDRVATRVTSQEEARLVCRQSAHVQSGGCKIV